MAPEKHGLHGEPVEPCEARREAWHSFLMRTGSLPSRLDMRQIQVQKLSAPSSLSSSSGEHRGTRWGTGLTPCDGHTAQLHTTKTYFFP